MHFIGQWYNGILKGIVTYDADMVRTLATTVGDESCLLDSGIPSSLLASTSWCNSLIFGVNPDASARNQVIMSTS